MPATFYTHLEGTNVKLEYDAAKQVLTLHGAVLEGAYEGDSTVYLGQVPMRTTEIVLMNDPA